MMSNKVMTPIVVENIPKLLDLVQPSREIMRAIEAIPMNKAIPPRTLGKIRSLLSTGKGNPSVVIMKILVMANIETRKAPVASMAKRNMFILILSESLLSKSKTNTVREKPQSNALINCV